MTTKPNAKRSFAEEGLEQVSEEAPTIEATLPQSSAASATPDEEDGEMVQVGGLEQIAAYYQLRTPTKQGKTPVLIFEKGKTLKGVFERVISRDQKAKNGQKFKSYTYLVRMDGKLYGFSAPGLKRGFEKLEPGPKSDVAVTYIGSSPAKDGGNDYENFTIFGRKLKAS